MSAAPTMCLPTARSARFSSGLGVLDFMKRTSIPQMRAGPAAKPWAGGDDAGQGRRPQGPCALGRTTQDFNLLRHDQTAARGHDFAQQRRRGDARSRNRSGVPAADIEHDARSAIYDLRREKAVRAWMEPTTGHSRRDIGTHRATGLMFDIRRDVDGEPGGWRAPARLPLNAVPANREGLLHDFATATFIRRSAPRRRTRSRPSTWAAAASMTKGRARCRSG